MLLLMELFLDTCASMHRHSMYHSLCRTHHAEPTSTVQGHTHKAKAEEQQQQQQRGKLREECSMGMMPGHFVMLSRQWGPVVKLLQGQRNKRKAGQAFQDVPLTGEPMHTSSPPFIHGRSASLLPW